MSTLKNLKELENDMFEKSMRLRTLQFDKRIKNYKKSKQIQDYQQETYEKHRLVKGLLKHWKEEK